MAERGEIAGKLDHFEKIGVTTRAAAGLYALAWGSVVPTELSAREQGAPIGTARVAEPSVA